MEFDSQDEGRETECPHCHQPISLIAPPAIRQKPPELILIILGEITVTSESVITPNGNIPLGQAQWLFDDASTVQTKMPAYAIVLAVVLSLLICILSMLFLLIKETTVSGYVNVIVQGGGVFFKTQIPVSNKHTIGTIKARFDQAQRLSIMSRG